MSDLQKQVREFIVENFMMGMDETDLENDQSFLETGLLDSTGILEVIGFLEETYEFDVDDEEMTPENFDSVNNLVGFIQLKNR